MGARSLIKLIFVFLLVGVCQLACADTATENCPVKGGYLGIANNLGLAFARDYKLCERSEDFYYTYSSVGLIYKPLPDNLELGFNYRQLYQQTEADPWKPQDSPAMNVTIKGQILSLNVSNGTCLEYRKPEYQKEIVRYANNFTVSFPPLSAVIRLQPYFSHDFFIDTGGDNFEGTAFSSGVSLKLSRNLASDFYYRWQENRYGEVWTDVTILGTSLRFTF